MDVSHLSLKIEEEEFMFQHKSDMAIRSSCKDCGTPMFMQYYMTPDSIGVAAGTVDEASLQGRIVKPNHIFVAEKAGWYILPEDGLDRHDMFPPEFQEAIERWKQQVNRK